MAHTGMQASWPQIRQKPPQDQRISGRMLQFHMPEAKLKLRASRLGEF
jgi:hypothetical protein